MKRILNGSFLVGVAAVVLAACGGGGGGSAPPAPPAPTLSSITVTPSNPSTALNSRIQLTATGTYSDGSTANITSSVTWSSSDTAKATVGVNNGLLSPVVGATTGTVTATATSGAVSNSTTITLTSIPTYSITGCTTSGSAGCEPLTYQQWGILNTAQNGFADGTGVANTGGVLGTDVNAASVYSTYGLSGYGTIVGVVDSGLEIAHEDLSANVVPAGSWNFLDGTTNPTSTSTTGDHGTSVAGLIAMAQNGIGGLGVASKAQLKGYNMLASGVIQYYSYWYAALGGSTSNPNSSDVSIFNQSYGSTQKTDSPIDPNFENQYAYGVTSLRGGKGAIYVKSAGNGFTAFGTAACGGATTVGVSCQNPNFDPKDVLPYNIVVAALNASGVKSSYSSAGSAMWVSTPGGEYGQNNSVSGNGAPATNPAMVTADQSGCASGYSYTGALTSLFAKGGTNLSSINLDCNYTNTFNGTSSAAPMLSGVIALILEANPALSWRDVKHILASTAVPVDTGIAAVTRTLGTGGVYTLEQGWVTNGATRQFHNWYGFGAVDASAAVALAKGGCSAGCGLGTFANTGWLTATVPTAPNNIVPDDNTAGVSSTATAGTVGTSGFVESVQVKVTTTAAAAGTPCVTATDGCTGDISIELTSPAGTKSILKTAFDGLASAYFNGMVLASNAFYGESSAGTWTVKLVDAWASSGNQTVTGVQVRIYGH